MAINLTDAKKKHHLYNCIAAANAAKYVADEYTCALGLQASYSHKPDRAFDNEEWFNGMVGLSVPITKDNSVFFFLSTHTAKSRKNIEDLKKILPLMLNAGDNLKKILFKY